MEAPFPGVSTADPVREAVELLTGEAPGADRLRARPAGRDRHPRRPARVAGLVTPALRHPRRARGPGARPGLRRRRPARSTRRRPTCSSAPGEFVERLRLLALGEPDAHALETRARRARGRAARTAFSSGMAGDARADHRGLHGRRRTSSSPTTSTAAPTGSSTRCSRAGGWSTRWSTRPTSTPSPPRCGAETKLIWVETPTNPTLNVVDIEAIVARKRRRVRGGRQHVRDARLPAAAGARRRRRRALDDEVPRRALGRGRRRGGRARRARCTRRVKFVQNSIGAVPGPLDCFLVHRGLRTLHLRMAAHTENARAVSEWLREASTASSDVRWPGFAGMVSFRHADATRIAVAHEGVLARRVARRRGVADRGPAGDDAPVRRGLRRGRAGRPRAAVLRHRGPPRTWSRTSRRRSACPSPA